MLPASTFIPQLGNKERWLAAYSLYILHRVSDTISVGWCSGSVSESSVLIDLTPTSWPIDAPYSVAFENDQRLRISTEPRLYQESTIVSNQGRGVLQHEYVPANVPLTTPI